MKKCPFCGADLADDARFCLYCMTSLDKKETVVTKVKQKKWWFIVLAAILFFLLIGGGIWFALEIGQTALTAIDGTPSAAESGSPSEDDMVAVDDSSAERDTDGEMTDGATNGAASDGSRVSTEAEQSHSNDQITSTNPSVGNGESTSSNPSTNTTTSSAGTTTASTKPSSSTASTSSKPSGTAATSSKKPTSSNATSSTAPNTGTTTPPADTNAIEEITWYYRAATSGDYDKRYNQVEVSNAIVITGFASVASNGIYKIPETIDGKTVVALNMNGSKGYTFADPAVKNAVRKIYLPPALNRIAANTFAECVNLTDVYIAGAYFYAEPSVFAPKSSRTGTLTMHCVADSWCLYGAKYFDVYCSPYGGNEYAAAYQEWDGGVYN